MTSGNCLFLGSDKIHVALRLNQYMYIITTNSWEEQVTLQPLGQLYIHSNQLMNSKGIFHTYISVVYW